MKIRLEPLKTWRHSRSSSNINWYFDYFVERIQKTSDDERNRLKTWYIPRLTETRKYQKELTDELVKIKQDAELLPSMFRAEAVFRN